MKVKCKLCGDIIEGDKRGTYITCKCGKLAIDETPYYCRLNFQKKEDFEIIKENKE